MRLIVRAAYRAERPVDRPVFQVGDHRRRHRPGGHDRHVALRRPGRMRRRRRLPSNAAFRDLPLRAAAVRAAPDDHRRASARVVRPGDGRARASRSAAAAAASTAWPTKTTASYRCRTDFHSPPQRALHRHVRHRRIRLAHRPIAGPRLGWREWSQTLRHRGPDDRGYFYRWSCRARRGAAEHHRRRRRPSADLDRRRRDHRRAERRDLQLRRAARGARARADATPPRRATPK